MGVANNNMTEDSPNTVFEVVIRESTRDYGYIFWKHTQDEEARLFFGGVKKVRIWVNGSYVGEKPIDWHSRRIFVGLKCLRSVPKEASIFRLESCGGSEIRATSL